MPEANGTIGGGSMPAGAEHDLAGERQLAAGALFLRCGMPELEARRRGALREALRATRALASALEGFADRASAHHHGVHASAGIDPELGDLAQALDDWSFAVRRTAAVGRACAADAARDDPSVVPSARVGTNAG
jgi:hypothetical protein